MKFFLFILCLFFANSSTAQNYVFDKNTKKPIKAVHILFDQNRGLVTNDDGYFKLPNNIDIDTLYFSHIQYNSKKISSKIYKENDTIFLEKSVIELDEIVLDNINPKEIVLKAIKNIDKNYISTPHNLFGFFRQSLKEDSKGIEMIEVEFINYTKNNDISTKITGAKRTENYSKWNLRTYGGVSAMIEKGDFVRQKAYFLDNENINDYGFEFKGKIEHEGMKVYKINFIPINNNKLQNLRKGTLYIDSNSLAFIEIRYTFDKEKLLKLTQQQSKEGIPTKKAIYVLKNVENTIKYQQLLNKKWCLYYIDFHNILQGKYRNEKSIYNLKGKVIINNIKTKRVAKIKTNYKLSKDFNRAVKKFKKLKKWGDTYKFSLSNEEREILKDINSIQKR